MRIWGIGRTTDPRPKGRGSNSEFGIRNADPHTRRTTEAQRKHRGKHRAFLNRASMQPLGARPSRGISDLPPTNIANTKTQRHEGITQPSTGPVLNAKAQSPPPTQSMRRRREPTTIHRVARSRPSSDDGRGPLRRTPVPIASDRHWSLSQRPALSKSAALATPLLHFIVGGIAPLSPREARRNRRAPGASAGEKHGDDGR